MEFGKVTLSSKGPMSDQNVFLMAKSKLFIGFQFSVSISGDAVYYFIEMIMHINFE